MPNPIDPASVITLLKISQYLWSNDKSKSTIFQGGAINRNIPNLCRMVRKAIEYTYGANPNDTTLIPTCEYGITLIHPRAQLVLSSGTCVAPVIITNPLTQSVADGVTVTFTVVATGTATLSYQWQYNLANITGETDSSLELTGVSSSDNGAYRCVVTNSCGTAISATATLTVAAPALAFTIGWSATDPFVDTSTPLTMINSQNVAFTTGGSLTYIGSLVAFANQYPIWKFPATEPTPTAWSNSVLNNGPIPDFSMRDVWTVGSFKYACARNPMVLDTSGNLVLSH